jgi:hypothetical protein
LIVDIDSSFTESYNSSSEEEVEAEDEPDRQSIQGLLKLQTKLPGPKSGIDSIESARSTTSTTSEARGIFTLADVPSLSQRSLEVEERGAIEKILQLKEARR